MRVLHTYSRLGVLNCPSHGIHGSIHRFLVTLTNHPERFPLSLLLGERERETLFSGLIGEEGRWRRILPVSCRPRAIYIYVRGKERERERKRDVSYTSYRIVVRTWRSRPRDSDYLMGPRLRSGIKCNIERRDRLRHWRGYLSSSSEMNLLRSWRESWLYFYKYVM